MFILDMITCGTLGEFDSMIPAFTSLVINAFKIIIPILLIVFGMIDLGKAVMSNDEKEMKGAQGKFIKRIIYAVIIFFIVAIVQLVFGLLNNASDSSDSENDSTGSISECIDCFVNGPDSCTGGTK